MDAGRGDGDPGRLIFDTIVDRRAPPRKRGLSTAKSARRRRRYLTRKNRAKADAASSCSHRLPACIGPITLRLIMLRGEWLLSRRDSMIVALARTFGREQNCPAVRRECSPVIAVPGLRQRAKCAPDCFEIRMRFCLAKKRSKKGTKQGDPDKSPSFHRRESI